MLTMRSSSVTKMAKPPPPVPPRPSKSIVAEALKRRRNPEDTNTIPVRSAPPPPLELTRSQSNNCVNFSFKKPMSFERSISDELKSNSRTVVFQSSNMKNSNNNVLVRKDSTNRKLSMNSFKVNKIENNKVISEKDLKNDVVVTAKNILNSCEVSVKNSIKITQDSGKTADLTNIVTYVPVPIEEEPKLDTKIENFETETCSGTQKRNSFDEKWEDMLKDKNHVNMLIDEMFASVLEVSKNEEHSTTTISTDSTTITINGCDNKYESQTNKEINGSTVLIIEGKDDQIIDKNTKFYGNSLTKIRGSEEHLDFSNSNSSTMEKKSVQFDDKKNAEFLIEELECMRMEHEKISKRQRKPSFESQDGEECENEEKIKNCHINIVNLNGEKGATLDYERLKVMSSLHGLPPLPKSLSGFNLSENYINPPTPVRTTSMRNQQGHNMVYTSHKSVNGPLEQPQVGPGRKPTNLDAQLAILRREMYSLRQLDLSLLSQLWSLNESIQDFRQILQDQDECRVLSPPSPSPVPSSGDEGDGDEQYYVNAPPATPSMKFRPAPPPPPPARRSSNSSNASTGA